MRAVDRFGLPGRSAAFLGMSRITLSGTAYVLQSVDCFRVAVRPVATQMTTSDSFYESRFRVAILLLDRVRVQDDAGLLLR